MEQGTYKHDASQACTPLGLPDRSALVGTQLLVAPNFRPFCEFSGPLNVLHVHGKEVLAYRLLRATGG
jgi:hypothetical protein